MRFFRKKRDSSYLFHCIIVSTSDNATEGVIKWMKAMGKSPMIAAGLGTIGHGFKVDDTVVRLIIQTFNKDWMNEKVRIYNIKKSITLIISFDKGDRASFDVLSDLIQNIRRNKKFPSNKILIVVVGFFSESDQVTTEEGRNLVKLLEVDYFESQPMEKEVIEGIIHDRILNVLKRQGISGTTIKPLDPPSEEDIQQAKELKKKLIRKLIFEDKLAYKIEIDLPTDTSPEDVEMHKDLWQEYQDPRIIIRQKRDKDEED